MNLAILQHASYLAGTVAFTLLTFFLVVSLIRKTTGKTLLVASVLTLLWSISLWWQGFFSLTAILESAALLAWIVFLHRLIGQTDTSTEKPDVLRNLFRAAIGFSCLITVFALILPDESYSHANRSLSILYLLFLFMDIIGLIFLEQVIRNTKAIFRWRQRYMSIALSTIFGFSLVLHATALMFNSPLPELAILQPLIYGLAAPFIVIFSLRNRNNLLRFNISREFVFRSGVLFIIGLFLLSLGIAGYYARLFHGDWGTALIALAGTVGAISIAIIVGSTRTRRHLRILLTKTLFEYKYDYRDEWLRVTRLLSELSQDYTLPQQSLRALIGILNSDDGTIWRLNENQLFVPIGSLSDRWNLPLSPTLSASLIALYSKYNWVLDMNDISPEIDSYFQVAHPEKECPEVRYVIPLFAGPALFGVAMLNRPLVPIKLEWEDFDVLKLIGNQSAHVLALQQADFILREAEQLRAFQQISAFLVHDIKTISAQLSLLVQNAERHRNNPAFIEDMIGTTRHAVDRMQKLILQLKNEQKNRKELVNLTTLTQDLVASFSAYQPSPVFNAENDQIMARIDTAQFQSALGHLIHNAVDATEATGTIRVLLNTTKDWIEVLIHDSGQGMDADFVRDKLFQPFASTKGLSGMGIGVYQAREYLRGMGGEISVSSEVNVGTCFTMRLPMVPRSE